MGLGIVIGLAAGGFGGFKAGSALTSRPATFWVVVGLLFAVAVVTMTQALRTDALWLAGTALGALAGGLTGLKYGRDVELRSLLTPPGR
jgi:hypothetical protein